MDKTTFSHTSVAATSSDMQKWYLAMELPNPVIIGIFNLKKNTFNLGSFENYIYIMQEAKKSMSSLNLVFFTHFTSDHLYLILWANIV